MITNDNYLMFTPDIEFAAIKIGEMLNYLFFWLWNLEYGSYASKSNAQNRNRTASFLCFTPD